MQALCHLFSLLSRDNYLYRNTVEISEISENHLRAIVDGRQVAEVDAVSDRSGKVEEKTQGEGKAAKTRSRAWHSMAVGANYIDLRKKSGVSEGSPSDPKWFDGIS